MTSAFTDPYLHDRASCLTVLEPNTDSSCQIIFLTYLLSEKYSMEMIRYNTIRYSRLTSSLQLTRWA